MKLTGNINFKNILLLTGIIVCTLLLSNLDASVQTTTEHNNSSLILEQEMDEALTNISDILDSRTFTKVKKVVSAGDVIREYFSK